MIDIIYIGESLQKENHSNCSKCGSGSKPEITRKEIFGVEFEAGVPKSVPVSEVGKFIATGLFEF